MLDVKFQKINPDFVLNYYFAFYDPRF